MQNTAEFCGHCTYPMFAFYFVTLFEKAYFCDLCDMGRSNVSHHSEFRISLMEKRSPYH